MSVFHWILPNSFFRHRTPSLHSPRALTRGLSKGIQWKSQGTISYPCRAAAHSTAPFAGCRVPRTAPVAPPPGSSVAPPTDDVTQWHHPSAHPGTNSSECHWKQHLQQQQQPLGNQGQPDATAAAAAALESQEDGAESGAGGTSESCPASGGGGPAWGPSLALRADAADLAAPSRGGGGLRWLRPPPAACADGADGDGSGRTAWGGTLLTAPAAAAADLAGPHQGTSWGPSLAASADLTDPCVGDGLVELPSCLPSGAADSLRYSEARLTDSPAGSDGVEELGGQLQWQQLEEVDCMVVSPTPWGADGRARRGDRGEASVTGLHACRDLEREDSVVIVSPSPLRAMGTAAGWRAGVDCPAAIGSPPSRVLLGAAGRLQQQLQQQQEWLAMSPSPQPLYKRLQLRRSDEASVRPHDRTDVIVID